MGEVANGNATARWRSLAGIGLAAVALAWTTAGALAAEPPQAGGVGKPSRIVSLDLCTDQLLVELVDRGRIAAVTHLAADPSLPALVLGQVGGLP